MPVAFATVTPRTYRPPLKAGVTIGPRAPVARGRFGSDDQADACTWNLQRTGTNSRLNTWELLRATGFVPDTDAKRHTTSLSADGKQWLQKVAHCV